MINSYERVLELMGQTNDGPLFAQFVEDLGEEPYVLLDTVFTTEYDFAKSGLHLSFDKSYNNSLDSPLGGFAFAIFSLAINPTSFKSRKSYSGNLPAGIVPNDSLEEVEKKLGEKCRDDGNVKMEMINRVPPVNFEFSFLDGGKSVCHFTISTHQDFQKG